MAEEIGFENGRNSNFEGLVTLTLTLDPAIRHTVVHHSSTSTYIPNFIEIEETFCGRTDRCTDIPPPLILLGRLLEVDLKNPTAAVQCPRAGAVQCDYNVSIWVLQEYVKPSIQATLLLRTCTTTGFRSWENPACITLLGVRDFNFMM